MTDAITVKRLTTCLGAIVEGVDPGRTLPAVVIAQIEAALDRHAVLVFPGVSWTEERQVAFSRRFGAPQTMQDYTRIDSSVAQELGHLCNLDEGGRIWRPDHERRLFNSGTSSGTRMGPTRPCPRATRCSGRASSRLRAERPNSRT
jgi:alpha-ketoglutarate-dependent 2,4-dichlorophenoxyacetate dioxygenase